MKSDHIYKLKSNEYIDLANISSITDVSEKGNYFDYVINFKWGISSIYVRSRVMLNYDIVQDIEKEIKEDRDLLLNEWSCFLRN